MPDRNKIKKKKIWSSENTRFLQKISFQKHECFLINAGHLNKENSHLDKEKCWVKIHCMEEKKYKLV